MKLVLPDDAGLLAAGLSLLASPLVPYPEEPDGWLRQRLRASAPVASGVHMRTSAAHVLTTRDGWTALLVDGETDAGEARLGVLFRLLTFGAAVIIRGPEAAVAAQRPAILDLLQRARLDWSREEPVCLHDLLGPLP